MAKALLFDSLVMKDFKKKSDEDFEIAVKAAIKFYEKQASKRGLKIVGKPYAMPQLRLGSTKTFDVIVRALIQGRRTKTNRPTKAVKHNRVDERQMRLPDGVNQ